MMFESIKNYFSNHSVVLNEEQNRLIDNELQQRTVSKDEVLLRQGENCKYTFFVAKGLLRAFTINQNGKEHILQFAPEDWFISDRSSILFGDKSKQFIEAVEDSEVILIEFETFEKLGELSPEFQKFNMFLLHN